MYAVHFLTYQTMSKSWVCLHMRHLNMLLTANERRGHSQYLTVIAYNETKTLFIKMDMVAISRSNRIDNVN